MNTAARQLEPFLFLYINEECNLRCTHCYMGERLERASTMSVDFVREILKTTKLIYGQYKVYLLGGEPTMHPHLSEILDICKEEGFQVVLTSNGAIPRKKWDFLTKERIDSFSFSLDGGTKESHEAMRGVNTFAPLLKSIEKAVSSGFQTRCIYTVTSQNIDSVDAALDLTERMGVEMLSFHYYSPMGRGINRPEIQIPARQWINFCKKLQREADRRETKIFYPPAFIEPSEMERLAAAGYQGCTARNVERLAVFPDRRVYLCSAFLDASVHYGTIENGRIVPQANAVTEMALAGRVATNCKTCLKANFCRAGCAAYDYFDRTHPTKTCDGSLIPICPLWTMPAKRQGTQTRHLELR